MPAFKVGVSRDFLFEGRNLWGDICLDRLEAAGLDWEYLAADVAEFAPEDLAPYDGVIFAAPAVGAASFRETVPRPVVLARFGVGYDTVDLAACTANDVALTITPDGARAPVAGAALALLLAVQHNLALKDRLVREGRWGERAHHMGVGLTGATIGLIGVGNTGSAFVRLLTPFGVRVLGFDPFCSPERAAEMGVELVELTELATQADAVVIMAALTEQTRHLVNADFLAAMKPDAVLINVARGPIVDEVALIAALRDGIIRAAGLDVFENEPPTSGIELLDNVTLAPHALAWTSEMSRGNGGSCVQAILDAAAGEVPKFVVNRDVLDRASFQARLTARR